MLFSCFSEAAVIRQISDMTSFLIRVIIKKFQNLTC